MKKRYFWLTMVTAFFFLSITALSWAQSQLWVVRASDNTLWKQTCTGLTCTGWTRITGLLAQQPTLIWDESIGRYVLTGVATNGTIWRSTFTASGDHNNDWVQIPGNTPSPVAVAGGNVYESNVWYSSTGGTTTIGTTCTNYSGGTLTLTAPADGRVFVEGTIVVYLNHENGTPDEGRLNIGTSAADCTSDYFSEFSIPAQYPTSRPKITVNVGEGFSVSAGTTYTFYLNGRMTSGQDEQDYFYWGRMKAVFYPN